MKNRVLFLLSMLVVISAVCVCAADKDSSVIKLTLLNQDPNPARAGDLVNLRFKVENSGGKSVEKLDIELIQDYPFTVVSGEAKKSISNLDAYQAGKNYLNIDYTVKIDKDAVQGQRQLQLKYSTNYGIWETVSFSVNIVSKEFAQIIYVDKAKLDPGKETDMKFTITNIGNAPLQNMIFSWQEPNGAILPVYSSDTKYVKYLDVGESVDLTYKVIADVNTKPGLYQLNLNLKSESVSNSTSNIISTKAGIFIGGETDFDVAFSESSAGQTSLSVANTGNNPAQSVSVKIPQQQLFRVAGSNSAIIGNLDKGDYTIVSFQIVQSGSMNFTGLKGQSSQQNSQGLRINISKGGINVNNGGNDLKVLIEYTDTTGERRSVEKNVPIQFRAVSGQTTTINGRQTQQKSGFIGSVWFWVLIIVVVIGFFVLKNKTRRQKIIGFFSKKR